MPIAKDRTHNLSLNMAYLIGKASILVGGREKLPNHQGLEYTLKSALDQHHASGKPRWVFRHESCWVIRASKPAKEPGAITFCIGNDKVRIAIGGEIKASMGIQVNGWVPLHVSARPDKYDHDLIWHHGPHGVRSTAEEINRDAIKRAKLVGGIAFAMSDRPGRAPKVYSIGPNDIDKDTLATLKKPRTILLADFRLAVKP